MTESGSKPLDSTYVLVNARHGRFLANRMDSYIGRGIIEFGEFSEGEVDLFEQITRSGDYIVEIGANIGTHTIPLAKMVGPSGFVYAIEMQPLVFQMLCANLALNEVLNVDARNLACGSETSEIPFPDINYSNPGNFGGLGFDTIPEAKTRRSVEVKPLDTLGCKRLDLLKIDVEGAELEVLKGAQKTVASFRPAIYIENDRREKSSSLIKHIQGLGYRLWWHLPPLFNPRNWSENANNPWPGIVSCNMLCLPKEKPSDITGLQEVLDPDEHPLRK